MPTMRINRFTAGYPAVEVESDQGQQQILAAYRDLRTESLRAFPLLAVGAVSAYLAQELPVASVDERASDSDIAAQAVVAELEADSRIRSRLTVGMLGSCQTALVVCAGDPTLADRSDNDFPEHHLVAEAFEAVADGANELGEAGPEGLIRLVSRAAPPAMDGLLRFVAFPERLAHHVVTWYMLSVSLGFNGDQVDTEVQQGLAMVLPRSAPHLG